MEECELTQYKQIMKPFHCLVYVALIALCASSFSGCLVGNVSGSGGLGATTVTDTNPTAIISAANEEFTNAGYSMGPANYPNSVSFDKSAGAFGKAMYGSYDQTTSYRAKVSISNIPGTNNYRIGIKVSRVNDAGQAGFEDDVPMVGAWAIEFAPLLQRIRTKASGAGGY